MAFQPKTYLRDHDDPDIKGLVILETDGDELRVTENRDSGWCKPFWMPQSELSALHTEVVGTLSDEKFHRVRSRAMDSLDLSRLA